MHEQAQRAEVLRAGAAEEWPAGWKWALAAILAAGAIVFVAGVTSQIVLGDEVYHTMFARAWSEAGLANRPTHNPLYASGEPPGYYYVTEPVWPMVLGILWRATGPEAWVAQAYQAVIYAVFLGLVWRLGGRFLGPRGALVAVLAAISVPMACAFSVMLYVDVPAAAVILAAVVLLLRRHFFWAGVLVGLAYLTKRNAAFLIPPLLVWLAMEDGGGWARLRRLALFLAPAVLVVVPDFVWRRYAIPSASDPVNPVHILVRLTTWFSPQRLSSNLNNPLHLLEYLGAVVPVLMGLYLIRRTWRKADRWLWMLLGLYLVTLVLFFTLDTDVRYVMPTVPILAVLAARGLEGWWNRKGVLALVAVAAFAQLGAAAWVVNGARHLEAGQRAVFAYLGAHTPPGTRVMYPGEVIMIEARRPVVWTHLADPETGKDCLPDFLTKFGPEKIFSVLRANDVRYLCVEKSRVLHEPLAPMERGGYPEPFVEQLARLPFLERVEGDWPSVALWKVKEEFVRPGGAGEPGRSGASP